MDKFTHDICDNILCNEPKCLIKKHEIYKKELEEMKKLNWQLEQFEKHISPILQRKAKLIAHLQNKGVFTWA